VDWFTGFLNNNFSIFNRIGEDKTTYLVFFLQSSVACMYVTCLYENKISWILLDILFFICSQHYVPKANSSSINSQGERYQGLAVVFTATSLALTFIAAVMHLSATCSVFFVGTKIEGFICIILIFLWVSIVTVVTNPKNDLAVDKNGAASNGNLYYFSWLGLIFSVMLETSFFRDVYNMDFAGQIQERAARLHFWSGLMLCGCVVMGSSANTYQNDCKLGYKGTVFCNRTIFAITLGTICAALSLFVVTMKIVTQQTFFVVESLLSTLLALSWAVGVGYITGEDGPGAPLGNLYYFTWGSFLLSFVVCSGLYDDYVGLKQPSSRAATTNSQPVEEEDI